MLKLRIGEAVIAFPPMETGIPWRLPLADTLKERLQRAVHVQDDLLHDLAVDLAVVRHGLLDSAKLGLLLLGADADATLTPRLLSFAYGGVVDVAAEHESTVKQLLLLWRRREFVLSLY